MSSADPAPPTSSPDGFLEASWTPAALAERGWRGAAKSLWRVLATTWDGVIAHRLPQQSAALTYYTLMSLGPLLGLALTVSGFILSRGGAQQDNPAKRAIVAAVEYAAPQIVAKASTADHPATLREINKDLDALVDRLLQTAASGEAGVIGLLLILGLAVLMLSRVEDALNGIWGVRFGRSWRDRFANYLLFLVLFFLVGATTLTMLSAASLAASFGAGATWLAGWFHRLPGGERLTDFVSGGGPLFVSLTLLTLAFAAFNRMMPNARVRWGAAFVGGLAIAVLVVGNHRLAALYVGKVTELQSLYGELSIVLVLMFGTYLSWLFVLIGGQVAYAFQNRRTLARHKSWEALSHRARRSLAFLCVAETLRRYRAGRAGPTAEDIGVTARVPASVAEGCLEMLRATGLLALESRTGGHKPARPLEALSIGRFWSIVDGHATGRAGDLDLSADPAAREQTEIEERLRELPGAGVTLGELASRG
jgi:membrane protein